MNEISVCNGLEGTIPYDLLYCGRFEQREVHNLYDHLMVLSTFSGRVKRNNKKNSRLFVLAQSFFTESQRFTGTWIGDNIADWKHLKMSIPMVFSYGITGIVFCSADLGGFFDAPDLNLLVR
jgi:alpha 1,3-glucosidase